jgi:hypothetical protein
MHQVFQFGKIALSDEGNFWVGEEDHLHRSYFYELKNGDLRSQGGIEALIFLLTFCIKTTEPKRTHEYQNKKHSWVKSEWGLGLRPNELKIRRGIKNNPLIRIFKVSQLT